MAFGSSAQKGSYSALSTAATHGQRYLKELSFCHKLKSSDPNIFATWWCKPL